MNQAEAPCVTAFSALPGFSPPWLPGCQRLHEVSDRLPDVHSLGGDGEPRRGEGVPVDGLGLRALGFAGRGGGKAFADLEHHVREGVVQEVEGANEGVAGGGGGARAGAGVNLSMYT